MSSVTFSTAVGGDGSTVTDDNNATTGLREGGWKTRFVPCFTQQVAVANYVVTKANEASSSASSAATSATAATTNGAAQVTLAAAQVSLATAQANAAAASYDSFDDRYLGSKTSAPSVDNDGNTLLVGALYWNSTASTMNVWTGSAWVNPNPATGYLALTGGTMTGNITFNSTQFGTNVATFLATPSSANLAAALTDETGTGVNVFNNTPTLIAPLLGTPTSGTLTNCTGLPVVAGTTGTLSVARGGTGSTSTTYCSLTTNVAGTLPVANGGTGVTTSTGSGNNVLSTSPTLTTPVLGTPSSGDLSNCTNAVAYGLKSTSTTVSISGATAPSSGQILTATSSTTATWQTPSGGGVPAYGEVGSVILAYTYVANGTTYAAGSQSFAGSSLLMQADSGFTYSNFYNMSTNSTNSFLMGASTAQPTVSLGLSGTWMNMMYMYNRSGANLYLMGLFIRVS
jgi:hypothetical protein